MRRHHDFVELYLDTLATDNTDAICHALKGLEGFLLNPEVELGSKADAAHHTQGVVAESDFRVEGRSNDAVLEVGNTVKGIYQLTKALTIQTDSHGIDGEVATVLVVFQGTILDDRLARVVAIALATGTDELNFYLVPPSSFLLPRIFHLCRTEVAED